VSLAPQAQWESAEHLQQHCKHSPTRVKSSFFHLAEEISQVNRENFIWRRLNGKQLTE